jgi:hypothetical protein
MHRTSWWWLVRALLWAALSCTFSWLPTTAQAADYSAGASLANGTATLWFKSNVGSTWVDAHYNVNGGAQMNVRMTYNNAAARFETTFAASAGQTVSYSFTYNIGSAAYDSTAGSTVLQSGGSGGTPPAAPTFFPAGGTYSAAQNVSISSATSGAVIHYTLDGSTPTSSSPTYQTPITVSATATVKAIASLSGSPDSTVSSATYTISGGTGGGGTGGAAPYTQGMDYANGVATLWLRADSTQVAWADIHYDVGTGQQNVRTSYNAATGRFEQQANVASGSLVKFSFTYYTNGFGAADTPLMTLTAGSSGGGTVATPTFSPAAGTYTSAQSVAISTATTGATIHYTTDGSTPTASSPTYASPVSVASSLTLKAIAMKSGMTDSAVASAGYTINISNGGGAFSQGVSELGSTATIWFKPNAAQNFVILHYQVGTGTQVNPQMVFNSSLGRYESTLSGLSAGQVINYSFTYSPVSGNQTDSPAYTYTMGTGNGIAKPTFSPAPGTYSSAVSVTLSTTAAGGVIRYTTDGSAPNNLSPQYSAPISVTSAMTINAISVLSDGSQSGTASGTYVVSTTGGKVATPVFSLASGSYPSAINVTLSSATSGAVIRFTTDGSTPTASSPAYGGPIPLTASATLKAIAIKSGMTNSDVASASYTVGTGSGQAWNGMTTFNVVNGTHGKYPDSQVYWAIIGKDWNTGQFVHVDASGHLVPMSLGDNGALTKNGVPYTNYFFSLAQTKSITIPAINSARILLSVGSPMYIAVNTDANGQIAYAGANIENPTDPNIDVTFDFGEFAILPPGSNPQGIFVNTTRVDQFGFPVQLSVTGLNGFSETVGEPLTETRDELFAKFINETAPPFAGLAQAPYAPYRIVAPAHATFQKDQPNEHYLDDYITQVWNQYTNQDLVIDLHNGWAPFTGRVVGSTFRFTDSNGGVYFINGKPSTSMVMLGNGLLDDPTGATTDSKKQLQLQAQLCAALNRHVAHLPFSSWWDPAAHYPTGQVANDYARFWHDHSLSALAYGFAYDDVGSRSPSIHTESPVSVTFTVGW